MILNKRIFLIYLLGTSVISTVAQVHNDENSKKDEIEDLSEVVITATRTQKNTRNIAVPTTVVSEKQIKDSGTARLNEILNEQTGVVIVPDESGFQGIQIQGLDADYILILVDNVPLIGRSSGNFDLRRLSVGNIKQVEIIKGPSSALYGSEALAGVVNIITKEAKNTKLEGNATYQIARFNQHDASINLGQKYNNLTYSGSLNIFNNDGYDLNTEELGSTVSPSRNYTAGVNLKYKFSEKFKLKSNNRLFKQIADASIFDENSLEFQSESTIDELSVFLGGEHKISNKTKLFYEGYYTNYITNEEFKNQALDSIIFENNFDQRLLRGEVRSQTNFNKNSTLIFGAGYQYDVLDRTLFGNEVSFNSQYAFTQLDLTITPFLSAVIGARFDNHSEYDNQLSPKLALNIKPLKNFSIKPSIGYGFKAPAFRQLYLDFTNPSAGYTVLGYNVAVNRLEELEAANQIIDLSIPLTDFDTPIKAENSVGYNLVLSYETKKLINNLNLFYNDVNDLIDTQIIARKTNGQNVFSYKNFNNIITYGLDFDTTWKVNNNTSISIGYQLLFAYDSDKLDQLDEGLLFARNSQNQDVRLTKSNYLGLPNRSRHSANLKVTHHIPSIGLKIFTRCFYRSKYGLFDTNGNGIIDNYDSNDDPNNQPIVDAYFLGNVTIEKEINRNISAQLGANNLLNYKAANISTLPGIQAFFKLNYKF